MGMAGRFYCFLPTQRRTVRKWRPSPAEHRLDRFAEVHHKMHRETMCTYDPTTGDGSIQTFRQHGPIARERIIRNGYLQPRWLYRAISING